MQPGELLCFVQIHTDPGVRGEGVAWPNRPGAYVEHVGRQEHVGAMHVRINNVVVYNHKSATGANCARMGHATPGPRRPTQTWAVWAEAEGRGLSATTPLVYHCKDVVHDHAELCSNTTPATARCRGIAWARKALLPRFTPGCPYRARMYSTATCRASMQVMPRDLQTLTGDTGPHLFWEKSIYT